MGATSQSNLRTGLHSIGFTYLRTKAAELYKLPGGLLPELIWKARSPEAQKPRRPEGQKGRRAVEEGGFSRKSRVLNRLRPDRQMIPV